MSDLMLDALFPPSPQRMMADITVVGARALGIYVLRRDQSGNLLDNGGWTSEHVRVAQQNNIACLPIMVPGSRPQADDTKRAILNAVNMGIGTHALAADIETFSFPPAAWLAAAISQAHQVGYKLLRYGDIASPGLKNYPTGDGDWISHGLINVRAGAYLPVPNLPAGYFADQYAVRVQLNAQYDVSIADLSYLGTQVPPSLIGAGQGMSLITIPDPDIDGAYWRFVHAEDLHVWWGVRGGGEGSEDGDAWLNDASSIGLADSMGSMRIAPGALSAIVHKYQGVKRVAISGRNYDDPDGRVFQLVVRGGSPDYGVIENWHPLPFNVRALVLSTGSGPTSVPKHDHTFSGTTQETGA